MPCHADVLMYRNKTWDLEFVYTIDNGSECEVTFQDASGTWQSVTPTANSLFMLQPNGAVHCAKCKPSKTKQYRTILKFIYVGDMRKSESFGHYIDNTCGASNPNVRELVHRRTEAWERYREATEL